MTNLGAALKAFIREHEYCGELRLVCQGVARHPRSESTRREAEPFSNHPNTFSPSSSDSLQWSLRTTVTDLPDALTMTKLDLPQRQTLRNITITSKTTNIPGVRATRHH